jgi:hypothetical protein
VNPPSVKLPAHFSTSLSAFLISPEPDDRDRVGKGMGPGQHGRQGGPTRGRRRGRVGAPGPPGGGRWRHCPGQCRATGFRAIDGRTRWLPGRCPLIFLSNGYRHRIWDDLRYPPREVQGFYKKDELETLIRRREIRQPFAQVTLSNSIAGRYYQQRAIRAICESLEQGAPQGVVGAGHRHR